MGMFPSDVSRSEAFLRAADSLLRALGPSEVILVLPVPVQQNNSDLGLAAPAVEQLSLSPAVVREIGSSTTARTQMEIMLSASTVNAQAESRNVDPPDSLFETALGIMHGEKLLRIVSISWESFADTPYLYRVTVSD